MDTIKREQKTIDAGMARCVAGEQPRPKDRKYRDADARILRLLNSYNTLNNNNLLPPYDHDYIRNNIVIFLQGISRNYNMAP